MAAMGVNREPELEVAINLCNKCYSTDMKCARRDTDVNSASQQQQPNLYTFLLGYRVEKGCDHTHTSFARPSGAFYIPSSAAAEFMALYKAALARDDDLYLTEHHRHIGPVVVDLDFKYEPSAEEVAGHPPTRRHDDACIEAIVSTYARHMADYVEAPASFALYVTMKRAPTTFKGLIKDGLHISIPEVVTRPEVQLLVRQAALLELGEILKPLGLVNRIEDVVDESVIERNNWMMYGSKKPQGEAYLVTHVFTYDSSTSRVTRATVDADVDYVELLSIRNKYDELKVRGDREDMVRRFVDQREERRKRREVISSVLSSSPNSRNNVCENLEQVTRLVDILDPARADSYNEWVRVGWCLRNIDYRLLDKWAEFSRRSDKYMEGECPRMWSFMRPGRLGIGTLHMWARNDSPERYRELLQTDLTSLIKASASGTHHDVAAVVHHMYRYDYVCASIRLRCWYEFRDHRWHESDSACSLRHRISTEIYNEYHKYLGNLHNRIALSENDDDKKQLEDQIKKLNTVASQLKSATFKDNVMRECSELFKRDKFEALLDSDCVLLGFENGVYDLERHEFREGRPDDHVSFTTGINYVNYVEDHPMVKAVQLFWSQVLPDRDVREYVLKTLASCLSGHTAQERFNIWTGSGCNGKSISVDLFERAMGDYCCKFPVTLLTQKRAASNAATSEIARAKGKRFSVLQEPCEDEKLNIGLMKELTGGDKIMARQLYREPIEFKPQFKLFLLCNHLPNVPSDDGGTWRRIRVVEFTSKFVESPSPERPNEFPIDVDLTQKLDQWKEHFMAMLIEYHKRSAAAGHKIDEPEAVMRCTRDYQRNNDHMADFTDTCIEKAPDPVTLLSTDDVFHAFKAWLQTDNIPTAKNTKKRDLQAYLDRYLTRGAQVSGCHCWRGFRIRDRQALLNGGGDDLA
jgi:P4 family phage/plasmid primase-like protien